MTADYKDCIDCGASFKRSRCDRTVRCMDCRKRGSASAAERRIHDAHYAMARAQKAGRDFRAEHGYDDDALVAAFKYAAERYREAIAAAA